MCRKCQRGWREQLEADLNTALFLPRQDRTVCAWDTYINMQPKAVLLAYVCNLLYWIKSSINSRASRCIDIEGNVSLRDETELVSAFNVDFMFIHLCLCVSLSVYLCVSV